MIFLVEIIKLWLSEQLLWICMKSVFPTQISFV
jgi:hypothetical protein